MTIFTEKLVEKSEHAFYVQELCSENRAVGDIMWRIVVEPDRTQMTI
jgi:hypothetical protein